MAIYSRWLAPRYMRLGTEHVIRAYLGEALVWDGTVPALVSVVTAAPATAAALAPAVSATPAPVTAPAAAGAAEALAPTVSATSTILGAVAAASASAPAPAVSADAVVFAPAATAGAAAIPPLSDAHISVPTATATASAPVPSVGTTGSAVVVPPPAAATASAPVPIVSASKTITAPAATASAAGIAPTVSAGASVTAVAAAASAAAAAPAVTATNFQPSGMNKSGTLSSSNAWTDVGSWTADTASYPGSSVNSNLSLVANGGKAGATLRAEVAFAPGGAYFSGTGFQVRILVNNVVVQTGSGVAANSGTAVCQIVQSISPGDLVKVQANANSSFTIAPVIQVSGTFVHIT